MKQYIICGLMLGTLSACSSNHNHNISQSKIGIPNPASQFCVDQGGKLEIRNEANGQIGYCHLPNGKIVEEWELLRDDEQKCLAEAAHKLIGNSELSDEYILKSTQSSIIRKVQPNQPVTMDYRENRITITIDPMTKVIKQATCG